MLMNHDSWGLLKEGEDIILTEINPGNGFVVLASPPSPCLTCYSAFDATVCFFIVYITSYARTTVMGFPFAVLPYY